MSDNCITQVDIINYFWQIHVEMMKEGVFSSQILHTQSLTLFHMAPWSNLFHVGGVGIFSCDEQLNEWHRHSRRACLRPSVRVSTIFCF